jgi:transaldolase/glucose-6-phosphate isomerase
VSANPFAELQQAGQSLWLDNIRRQLVTSGELARLRDEGVTGVTSNPTIFEKAVSGSTDYDEALVRLVNAGETPDAILWDLMLEDIRSAADVFLPVYERTDRADGFVSIEVSPKLANDTRKTVEMAKELFRRADRPNVMVKIPATKPGLPAIRETLAEGINVNVTLIFSTERYDDVVDAFISGVEDFTAKGGDPRQVASVASFFVSRVDSKVDKLLDERIEAATDPGERERLQALRGTAAIANSKEAYQHYLQLFGDGRWQQLAQAGARPQRCLWASTSTKDPRYSDTMYVEELIGPDTVDTVPPATLAAFREHGEVRRSLDDRVDVARRQLADLAELGIDLREVTEQLEVEGVDAFEASFDSLLDALQKEARAIKAGKGPRQWHALGTLQPAVDAVARDLEKAEAPRRLWAKDSSLWPEATRPEHWLGWLNVPEKMLEQAGTLAQRAQEAREFADVVVFGMGGSSLAPDVFRATFGTLAGHPRLHVLDTTDPATILELHRRLDLATTLFIASSKSGTTTETRSHLEHFWEKAREEGVEKPEANFAVVTDAGSDLERLASERDYRWIFTNPSDIGGRFSALSYFGLVPAAFAGVDVHELLERAQEMAQACDASVPVERNPGVWLGAILGGLAREGRNKVTLLTSPKLAGLGAWIEQLLAESTGKDGRGLVPVDQEPVGPPEVYGSDRVFVHTRLDGDPEDAAVRALQRAGQPVVTLTLRNKLDLGAEFLRWEIAVAVAGSILGIDPFDQPNVQESKDRTNEVLSRFAQSGKLPEVDSVAPDEAGTMLAERVAAAPADGYVTVMAYTTASDVADAAIARIRTAVRDRSRLATTAGYGPRFLHSTGQFHKGGPRVGVFLQVVEEDAVDAEVPGHPYGFATLKQAQATGDLESLHSRDLPVVRVGLGPEAAAAGWARLAESVEQALGAAQEAAR